MQKNELMRNMVEENNGVFLASDVVSNGISRTYIREFIAKNDMEKVSRGLYLASDAWPDELFLLQKRYTQVIYSHETALYLMGMAAREPLRFSVTVKRGYHAASLEEKNVKLYTIRAELFETGATEIVSNYGNCLRTYNAERTVCDLIRSRNSIEIQDLQTALKEYAGSKEKNLPLLMRYAKLFRVERVLRQYLEVLL